ncbi:hypothetical protein D3C85_1456630 [compost metagenome]
MGHTVHRHYFQLARTLNDMVIRNDKGLIIIFLIDNSRSECRLIENIEFLIIFLMVNDAYNRRAHQCRSLNNPVIRIPAACGYLLVHVRCLGSSLFSQLSCNKTE